MSSSDSTWWIAGSPAVAEQPPHRQVRLALGGELGPVARDGRVQVDLAALGQPVGDDRERSLGRGRHQLQGAIGVGRLAVGGGGTAPQVDHWFGAAVHTAGGPHLASIREVALELVPHRLEAPRHRATDVHRPERTVGRFHRAACRADTTDVQGGLGRG